MPSTDSMDILIRKILIPVTAIGVLSSCVYGSSYYDSLAADIYIQGDTNYCDDLSSYHLYVRLDKITKEYVVSDNIEELI